MPEYGCHDDMTGEHEKNERLHRPEVDNENQAEQPLQDGRRELPDNVSKDGEDNDKAAEEVEKQNLRTPNKARECRGQRDEKCVKNSRTPHLSASKLMAFLAERPPFVFWVRGIGGRSRGNVHEQCVAQNASWETLVVRERAARTDLHFNGSALASGLASGSAR